MSVRKVCKIMDYASFYNRSTRCRQPSALRELFDSIGIDHSYVMMAGGLPNPEVFPVVGMNITLRDGTVAEVSQKDLTQGLQYGQTAGHTELRQFLRTMIKRLHDPPCMSDPDQPNALDIMVTAGANDAIYKVFEVLGDQGDTFLTEEYIYPNFHAVMTPMGCNVETVKTDKHGIIPESLEAALSKWPKPEDGKPSKGKLKALYCVPNGGNPTGIKFSLERKKRIYKLAQEYNFFIIEDDAYYFLEERPFIDSFLSMDVDGRVIRLETFSKTIAPGLRLGYVCAPKPIHLQMNNVSQASTQGSSSLSQMVVLELLRRWGVDGFLEHCEKVSDFYAKRRHLCEKIARKHLSGLAEWDSPSGGMFLWLRFKGIKDTFPLVMQRLLSRKVLIVTGAAFLPDVNDGSPFVRISYSMASEETMEKGFTIIAEEVRAILTEQKQ